ncbi:aldose 1-epimerase [Hyunsoonleella sp. 2307UL5-6]|uniref:aldose 1-epimerase n=1 Tax=Hyunsoonleella sp. 2307UL5-6 TaxID=3384768 RepID=UPI0039BD09C0
MYTIQHNKSLNILEIKNKDVSVYGKIYLNLGASLQELTLNNHKIIQDLSPLKYTNTYASSILFPFANRIKDGAYTFNGEFFQFEKNNIEEQNALHGLVFDKTFALTEHDVSEKNAKITLEYEETNTSKGFPYTYKIKLDYVFSDTTFSLKMTVVNTDKSAFPFTVGWHPYFTSANLFNSEIEMDANEKVVLGERNITTGTMPIKTTDAIKIKDDFFDDCWILKSDEVIFKTPEYKLQFNATGNNNFIQAYTPPKKNTIAIEPTTGVSDSFNNKIGLNILEPNQTYNITWTLNIHEN